jgi:hypothetical protein
MKPSIAGATAAAIAAAAGAQTADFSADAIGSIPAGWVCGVTGKGAPKWAVSADPETRIHVLLQSGSGTFPWCVRRDTAVTDGSVETTFKPISGREDRAGGVVWRWKDGDNYYVARANALENNVSLYYTERGSRRTLKYVDAPAQSGSGPRPTASRRSGTSRSLQAVETAKGDREARPCVGYFFSSFAVSRLRILPSSPMWSR